MSADEIVFNQHLDALDRVGFFEMHAKPDYVREIMVRLKLAKPGVRIVEKVGPDSIMQIVFMPSAATKVRVRLVDDYQRYLKATKNTAAALAQL